MIFSVFVFDTNAKTVCIRICCKNKICIYFFCKFQTKFKSFCCFRIRITYCWEISIRKFLFFDNINVLKSKFFEDSSCRNVTSSMKWCVHDLQILSFCLDSIHMNNLFLQFCHVCIVHFFADHLEKACFFSFSLVHSLNSIPIGNCLNFSHDSAVMWRCDLCTVLPVYFVSIVFRWVMACSYIDTGNTSQMTYRERKLRCRS